MVDTTKKGNPIASNNVQRSQKVGFPSVGGTVLSGKARGKASKLKSINVTCILI